MNNHLARLSVKYRLHYSLVCFTKNLITTKTPEILPYLLFQTDIIILLSSHRRVVFSCHHVELVSYREQLIMEQWWHWILFPSFLIWESNTYFKKMFFVLVIECRELLSHFYFWNIEHFSMHRSVELQFQLHQAISMHYCPV